MRRASIAAFLAAFFLVVFVAPAAVAQWSGSLDQGFSFLNGSDGDESTDDASLTSSTTVAFGSAGTIGRRLSYGVSIATSLSLDMLDPDFDSVIPDPAYELANVDTAYLNWPILREPLDPTNMTVTVGRFPISDTAGMVVSTPVDGFSLSMGYERMAYDIAMGYTGLLWQSANGILMSNTDVANSGDQTEIFGSPRLIGRLNVQLPLIFQQAIGVSAIFQEDMWSSNNVTFAEEGATSELIGGGGPVDTQYIGMAVTGPIGPTIYHSTFFYYNTGRMLSFMETDDENLDGVYQYKPVRAYLMGTSVRYYLPQFFRSAAALRFVLSSGDEDFSAYYEGNRDGNANQFVPVSAGSFGAVFSPKLGNVGLTEIQYSLKPLESSTEWMLSTLQTVARLMVFFRPTTGPISEPGVVTGEGGKILGTELDLSANLTPFPDLALSATFGMFLPASVEKNGAFSKSYVEDGKLQTSLSLQASLGF